MYVCVCTPTSESEPGLLLGHLGCHQAYQQHFPLRVRGYDNQSTSNNSPSNMW